MEYRKETELVTYNPKRCHKFRSLSFDCSAMAFDKTSLDPFNPVLWFHFNGTSFLYSVHHYPVSGMYHVQVNFCE